MAGTTKIGWTNETWNPWTGCVRVSPGCDHCYAERLAERFRGNSSFPNGFALTLHPNRMERPLLWKKPRLVFVNSMSDFFLGTVPINFLRQAWETMLKADWHVYQILTKRPVAAERILREAGLAVPPHIWIGVSAEGQRWADQRIPQLLEIPAEHHWVSCEPLLGPVDLRQFLRPGGLTWVVDGGESGRGRRPAQHEWFAGLRDQCVAAGVPYFHKQGNSHRPGEDRLLNGQTWEQFPGWPARTSGGRERANHHSTGGQA